MMSWSRCLKNPASPRTPRLRRFPLRPRASSGRRRAGVAAPPSAPAPSAAKPAGSSGPGDVPCPLAGRVTAVLVQAGQIVKEGEHLVTLEAMKMNTFVFAPRSGKVTSVRTEVGAVVEENQVLVTIG